uniref:Uncharacterized protein n=1 Tax=Meloidogyne enterolobii TaxID=390850 RepID=A0A6V7UT76_MELEN|nr:unnamed protein product [Meloidogyne enterolobii]
MNIKQLLNMYSFIYVDFLLFIKNYVSVDNFKLNKQLHNYKIVHNIKLFPHL